MSLPSATLTTTPAPRPVPTATVAGDFAFDRLLRLGVIAFQFGLLVLVVRLFRIENKAFLYLLALSFGGFLVHHFLPKAAKLPFFGLLSIAAMTVVLRPPDAGRLAGLPSTAWIVGLGGLLIGLCHLPISFRLRVGAILLVGAALAAIRAQWWPVAIPGLIWPLLGAMFMFRLIVYLYDLRHKTAPFSLWRSVAYFFMLPNVCFPLFPVVDYRTFCRSHYNTDALSIYQTGVAWMFRGIVQLLLYRLIYQNFLIDPATITDAATAAQYMVSTYLLYLKVSGSFHLIVGLLHMFGFNLSETNHRYLLSSSFTDFWRRINIYWKDFILKIFFNPMYLKLSRRKWGTGALVLATLYAFFATWALHSYQTFWIRGSFPIHWADVLFWGFLGVAVLLTALYETKFSAQRRKAMMQRGRARDAKQALCAAAMFITLVLLWTLWNSDSWAMYASTVSKLALLSPGSATAIGGGIVLLMLASILLGRSTRAHTDTATSSAKSSAPFWGPAIRVTALSGVILAVGNWPLLLKAQPALVRAVGSLKQNKLNQRDAKMLERGYYENLTDASRLGGELASLYGQKPADWNEDAGVVQTGGWPPYAMTPSTTVHYKGVDQTTNRWAMRDRDYEKEKPADVFRVAVMGSSHTKGSGVRDNETYENLVEDRLNKELSQSGGGHVEILNFSTGGYGPLCKLAQLRQEVLGFHPDVVLYEGIDDETWIINEIANAADKGHIIPFAHVNEVATEANVEKGLPHAMAEQRLKPYAPQLLDWVFTEFVGVCKESGVEPWVMFLPRPEYRDGEQQVIQGLMARAGKAGFTVLDMSGAYDSVADFETLWIAKWDAHPNAAGHRLLAEKLYANLKKRLPKAVEESEPGAEATRQDEGN